VVDLAARLNRQDVYPSILAIDIKYDPPTADPRLPGVWLPFQRLRDSGIVWVWG